MTIFVTFSISFPGRNSRLLLIKLNAQQKDDKMKDIEPRKTVEIDVRERETKRERRSNLSRAHTMQKFFSRYRP